jgi:hypothetical protein
VAGVGDHGAAHPRAEAVRALRALALDGPHRAVDEQHRHRQGADLLLGDPHALVVALHVGQHRGHRVPPAAAVHPGVSGLELRMFVGQPGQVLEAVHPAGEGVAVQAGHEALKHQRADELRPAQGHPHRDRRADVGRGGQVARAEPAQRRVQVLLRAAVEGAFGVDRAPAVPGQVERDELVLLAEPPDLLGVMAGGALQEPVHQVDPRPPGAGHDAAASPWWARNAR